jgi:hypothetical protein
MRLPSPLTQETEEIMFRIIGAAIAVHRQPGPGYLESAYQGAMCLELKAQNLSFERECAVTMRYRGVDEDVRQLDSFVPFASFVFLSASLTSLQRRSIS